jgi:hypothetical protein
VTWERGLLALFDELETQASGLAHEAREADVADLARSAYAEVGLGQRLLGCTGRHVTVRAAGGLELRGRVARVGRGVMVLESESGPHRLRLVNTDHLVDVVTASRRALDEDRVGVTARLGLASAIRHLAEEVDTVVAHLCDGRRLRGALSRVGADFVELSREPLGGEEAGVAVMVPLAALVALEGA